MSNRFTEWYEKNREQHNAKRRKRYHQDEEYREQVVRRQRAYRDRVSRQRQAERAARPQPKNEPLTVTEAAELLGRSAITVRSWEKRGLIPEAVRDSSGTRRYTRKQVAQLKRLAHLIDTAPRDRYMTRLPKLRESIAANW